MLLTHSLFKWLFIATLLVASCYFSPIHANQAVVLLPLDVTSAGLNKRTGDSLESTLKEGLAKHYSVHYGKSVVKALEKQFSESECTLDQCVKSVVSSFGAELIAEGRISGGKVGYIVSYRLSNIVSHKVILSKTVSCQRCSIPKLADVLRKLGENSLKSTDLRSKKSQSNMIKVTFDTYDKDTKQSLDGVSIYLNDKLIGKTPLATSIKEGVYQLKMLKALFQPIEKQLQLDSKNSKNSHTIRIPMTPYFGQLSIHTIPATKIQLNATNYVKSYTSPLKKQPIYPTNYKLTLSADGYQTISQNISIREQQTVNINKKLKPLTCQVHLVYPSTNIPATKELQKTITPLTNSNSKFQTNPANLPTPIILNKAYSLPQGNYLIRLEAKHYSWQYKLNCQHAKNKRIVVQMENNSFTQKYHINVLGGVISSGSSVGFEFGLEIEPILSSKETWKILPMAFRLFAGNDYLQYKTDRTVAEIPSGELTAENTSYLALEYKGLIYNRFALSAGLLSLTTPDSLQYTDINKKKSTLNTNSANSLHPYFSPSFSYNFQHFHINIYYRYVINPIIQPMSFARTSETAKASADLSRLGINIGISL